MSNTKPMFYFFLPTNSCNLQENKSLIVLQKTTWHTNMTHRLLTFWLTRTHTHSYIDTHITTHTLTQTQLLNHLLFLITEVLPLLPINFLLYWSTRLSNRSCSLFLTNFFPALAFCKGAGQTAKTTCHSKNMEIKTPMNVTQSLLKPTWKQCFQLSHTHYKLR